jgi:CheY-like chemotaxis protein
MAPGDGLRSNRGNELSGQDGSAHGGFTLSCPSQIWAGDGLEIDIDGISSSESLAKVLIVDDDPGVVQAFAYILRLEGYEVLTALSAEAALREVETSHPDAVLLDLRMPLMDGLTFLRRLRALEEHRHTPVAIVTGDYFVDDTITNELRELQADLYFKPVWLRDLVGITRRLIHRTI